MDMGQYLGCFPSFDSMEWYEFLSKYQILKKRIESKNNNGKVDLMSAIKSGMFK